MRLAKEKIEYLKKNLRSLPEVKSVYLFGSRTDDRARGGDIDILVLSDKYLESRTIRQIKIGFYKKFGWQKIDIVNFLVEEKHPFKDVAITRAVKL